MTQCEGKLDASVVFWKPENATAEWEQTELRREAAAVPGVHLLSDEDGREARRFGAQTSGHTLLYDGSGHLLFSGGITGSRGHAGDNAGRSAIVSLVNSGSADRNSTFVFGCSLLNPQAPAGSGDDCHGATTCEFKP
ncbi:MAG: hypothetical protein M3O82_05370 [Verrucomicrobiota bacterium]|nr:hypothetical protein [Verrucomicrobiota bacterium]